MHKPNKREQRELQMMEFLSRDLCPGYEIAYDDNKFFLKGRLGGVIVPVAMHIPGQDEFLRTTTGIFDQRAISFLFYKDRENFFRFSASDEREGFRQKYSRSLRHSTVEQRSKYMLLSPEERFVMDRRGGKIEYYQPKSENLEESLMSYHFKPVRYVQDPNSRFTEFSDPVRHSTRRFEWTSGYPVSGPYVIEAGRVISVEDPNVDNIAQE
jgi:hypothetical protein